MKFFTLLALALMSTASMAHTCHIALYDMNTRPFLNFYSQNDHNCEQAAASCVQTVQRLGLSPTYYRCYTISMGPDANPEPTPTVKPAPRQATLGENKRAVAVGETVIFNNKFWVVTDIPSPGFLNLIPDEKRKEKAIVENVNRAYVAITRGCHAELCTRDAVTDLRNRTTTAIIGIEYNGTFVTQRDADDVMMTNVPASDLQK